MNSARRHDGRRWIVTLVLIFACEIAPLAAGEDFSVLVFSKTLLYRHVSITNGVAMLKKLGAENGFNVDATEDASAFTSANLARYRVVVFLSTSGDVLDPVQQDAFRTYLETGGALVGIH